MRKRKDKGKVKPNGEFTLTWVDLVNPKDKKLVNPDQVGNAQPYDWDSEQAPE